MAVYPSQFGHTDRFENATLEEIEAFLDSNSVPEGWLDDLDPPKKKLKLSLKSSKSRFASVDEQKFTDSAKGVVPGNTKKCNSWAEKTFLAWVEERNKARPVPVDHARNMYTFSRWEPILYNLLYYAWTHPP